MPYTNRDRQREFQRQWRQKRRQDWLHKNGPCIDCQSWENLEVDHADSTTKDPILVRNGTGQLWSWSDARREKELKKCVVRCKRCHKTKTQKERRDPLEHGKSRGLYDAGCRCQPCKDFQAARLREYRLMLNNERCR